MSGVCEKCENCGTLFHLGDRDRDRLPNRSISNPKICVDCWWISIPEDDRNGAIEAFIGILNDISEKKAKEWLRDK